MATEQPGTQTDPAGEGTTVTNVQRIADELVLDRIDALRVLRADSAEEKGALLEQIAGPGKPEQDIVRELSKLKPLWRPDRFEEAHRWVMRSLEVLDRNGVRSAKLPRLGPLKVVATYVVQQITRWIVKGHQNTVVTRVRKLYERREANAEWGSAEHRMLRRARLDAQRVEQGYKADQLGLPTFLLGGAIFSTIVSGLQSVARAALENTTGQVIFAALLALVFFGLAWAALYAAAVARRRIRLCMDQPLKALWETIGACGNPPRDESYNFAIYAIVLLVLAWVAIPLAFWLVFH